MRIKEVEERTGLTAKAIRLYESKGLLKPARELENDYRDYTEEDVARLKTIAILRKLDVSVKTIKEWTDGKTSLRDILLQAAEENREASRESGLRHKLAEDLADLLEKDPEADLGEAVEVLEELDALVAELAEAVEEDGKHIGIPLFATLTALGPIGFTVMYILDGMPEKALFALALSIMDMVWVTLCWRDYLAIPKEERRHSGCLTAVLLLPVLIVLCFAPIIWIQNVRADLYVENVTDVILYRTDWLDLFFVIEMIALVFFVKEKPWKEIKWRRKTVVIVLAILLVVNAVILRICLTSVSVATEAGITRYSFFDPDGTLIPYTEIEGIDTGFRGKKLGLPLRGTGEFYYEITYSNGRTEDWDDAICHDEEVTWSWMKWLDEWILSGGAEKTGSTKYAEYCEMEQFYVDILIDVINNR